MTCCALWGLVLRTVLVTRPAPGRVKTAFMHTARNMACESLEDPFKSGIVYYDDKLDQRHRLQEYVLSHIDEALEKVWIQVYFQPVIRTLTDKVCNLEALGRWIDPPGPAQLGQLLYQVLDHAKPRGDGLCPG